MIRLCNTHRFYLKRRIFYFYTLDDCKDFMNVFKENDCKIEWGPISEIPDNTKIKTGDRLAMDRPPKERAQNALSWGFNIAKDQFSKFTA